MISVIIPTKDRNATLSQTLSTLLRCDRPDGGLEILVVDNGSTDATGEVLSGYAGEGAVRVLSQPEGGPAAARNAGIREATGDVVLLLGDDTAPKGLDLVTRHAALHSSRPEPNYAVLGRIEWDPRRPVGEFMSWLDSGGPQFHYGALQPGPVPAADHFYSSHLSLKRTILEQTGGFDERFPTAAVEDTEIGARMADAGLELDYHPELVVLHDHPTTLDQSLARMLRVGMSGALYNRLFPKRPHSGIGKAEGPKWAVARGIGPALGTLERAPLPGVARRRLWWYMHMSAYARGYRAGLHEPAGL